MCLAGVCPEAVRRSGLGRRVCGGRHLLGARPTGLALQELRLLREPDAVHRIGLQVRIDPDFDTKLLKYEIGF